MKRLFFLSSLLLFIPFLGLAQVTDGVYLHESVDAEDNLLFEKFMIQDGYAVLTQYSGQQGVFSSPHRGSLRAKK